MGSRTGAGGVVIAAPPPVAVSVRHLAYAYGGASPILRDVTLTAHAGEVTVVLGESGGGKTTLLRLIKGLLASQRGEIEVLGERPRSPRAGRLDPRVAYIPQQLGLVRSQSVLANALTGALARTGTWRSLLGWWPAEHLEEAQATLELLGIGEQADQPVRTLSGGERQRVAIARSLMQRPRVILADEFVSQLDAVTSREIMGLVREVAARGVAVIMTTHEIDMALDFADRMVVLRDGAVVLDAAAADVEHSGLVGAIRS